MKPKDALIKDKFPGVKPGKGRLSLPGIERCKYLAVHGNDEFPGPWDIDGYTVVKPTAAAPKDTPTKVVKATVQAQKVVLDVPDERYDERIYEAVAPNGKPVGMRQVCDVCGHSLSYHICADPRVMVNGRSTPIVIRAKVKA